MSVLVRRLRNYRAVTPAMLPGEMGANINGPSLIATPDWLPGRLGRYYLYFAHHAGSSIRLAYADSLEGPWRIHLPGTLQLSLATGCRGHIASPDVHVDEVNRQIVMYFHGPAVAARGQWTFMATSSDGLSFSAGAEPLAPFYLRVVRHGAGLFGMSKGGEMFRAESWSGPFERLPQPAFPMSGPQANGAGDIRHVALDLSGDTLWVYFSRIGDAPERILRAPVNLALPAEDRRAGEPEEVLAPDTLWEGNDLPVVRSASGAASGREHALRDPAVFREGEHAYLLYSMAGESGIGIAELFESPRG